MDAGRPLPAHGSFTLGLHPWHLLPQFDLRLQDLRQNLSHPHLVGLGEAGLDKSCLTNWDLQIRAYKSFLELVAETSFPLILHSVRSHTLCIQMARKLGVLQPIMIHGFFGSPEEALSLTAQGIYLGFGPSLFGNSKKTISAFKKVPKQYILLETDDQITVTIKDVYQQAATLLEINMEELIDQIHGNFFNFYGKLDPCKKIG